MEGLGNLMFIKLIKNNWFEVIEYVLRYFIIIGIFVGYINKTNY